MLVWFVAQCLADTVLSGQQILLGSSRHRCASFLSLCCHPLRAVFGIFPPLLPVHCSLAAPNRAVGCLDLELLLFWLMMLSSSQALSSECLSDA